MEKLTGANQLLKNVVCLTETPVIYKRVEFEMEMPKLPVGYNPFYEKDVALDIVLTSKAGTTFKVPGFCFQAYDYDTNGTQIGRAKTAPTFRIRVSLPEAGEWDYTITMVIRDIGEDSVSGSLLVADSEDKRGFIRVEPNRKQNFMFDDGTPYIAVGENMAWAEPVSPKSRHSAIYKKLLTKCAAEKANYFRLWSSSFAMCMQDKQLDPSYMNLADCDQYDRIVEISEELGLYINFAMYHHGQFSRREVLPEHDYHNSAYNMNNEGYLDDPRDFFTNPRAKRDTKSYMRYLVARWGYSPNIFCWEFFNEQDGCDAGTNLNPKNQALMVEWHQEMCDHFREIDPYHHLLTTSSAWYSNSVIRHAMFDFISIHVYNYQSLELAADLQKNDYRTYHRPVLMAEIGMNGGPDYVGPNCGTDKLELHQQHWICVMGGGAGTGASWFWPQVDRTNAYDTFRAVAEMAERIPWRNPELKMCDKLTVPTNHLKVLSQGYQLDNSAWLWFYDTEYRHNNRHNIAVRENVSFTVDLNDGEYVVTWIDPWSGDTLATETAVAKEGVLNVGMPAWQKDIAVTVLPK